MSIVAVETPGVRTRRLLVLARQHAAGKGVKDVEGYVEQMETSDMLAPHVPCKKKNRRKRHVDLIEGSCTLRTGSVFAIAPFLAGTINPGCVTDSCTWRLGRAALW